ncbi:MAG: hypothetical protein V1747_09290 [Candidatus Omnitrophota bacterium]
MRKSKIFRMGCFMFLGLVLMVSQAGAVNSEPGKISGSVQSPNIEQLLKFEIPSSWGIIKDSYNSGNDKLVVNIQDAHCDFEAQKNISNILNRLATNFKLKVIALEGAAGKVENPLLANFPEKKIRENVSLYLVKQGKLTGAEYFAVNSDQDLKLYGVEDLRLYMDNLDAFQQSQPFKTEARQYFSLLKNSLDVLKQSIYNDNLKKLDILENDYALKRISFDKYAIELYKIIEENGLRKVNYPIFYELQSAINLEAKVDFKKADTERMQIITALTQTIDDKETISQLIGKSLSFKKGMLSAGEFANFLKDLAFDLKLNMGAYPNFNAYADYITKYEQVANEELFLEIKAITKNLKKIFYTDDDQKQLDVLYQHLDVLVKLVELKMVNEDIVYFFKNRSQINSDSFTKFIAPQAYKHKAIVTLPAEISYIDVYIPAWAKFYELADTRDAAFIEKTLFYMNNENTDYAALITGGFHTKQLTKLLKEKKISYIVIAPKASFNDANPYFNIMQGGKSAIESFVSQMQSSLGVFAGADEGALETLSPSQQNTLKTMAKTEAQVTTLALAVETFGAIAADNPDATDKDIQEQVIQVFATMEQAGTDIDMDYIRPVIGQISRQGSSVVVKSTNEKTSAVLVFNPQAANFEDRITTASSTDVQAIAAAPVSKAADKIAKVETAEINIDNISVSATSKDVLKAILTTATAKSSTAALEPVQAAFIVEEVVSNLASSGTVDVKAVANKLKTEQPQLFSRTIRLEQEVENVVATAVSETLKNSPLVDKAADIVIGEKGLNVTSAKQETAKQIIKDNIADTDTMTVKLNSAGISVNKEQLTAVLNNGLSESSKTSANSGDIVAKVVVSKLGIQGESKKTLAMEIVKGSATSNAEVVTAKLKNMGLNVDKTQVAEALTQGLLQANVAANPIMSGLSSTSALATTEQESLIASQIKPSDISLVQYKAELQSGVPEGQGLVLQGDKMDQKILSIAENAGVKKDEVASVVVASGDYSKVDSVSVKIKPSTGTTGKVSIAISPKKTDLQTSETNAKFASVFRSVENKTDVLANEAKVVGSAVIAFQAKKLQTDIEEFQTTNVEEKSQADTAPVIKEKNVIVIPMSMLGEPDFAATVDNQIPVEIKGMATGDMWDRITEHNDVVIMHDMVGENKTEVSEIDFAQAMGIANKAVTFVGPLDIGEMQGQEIGSTGNVTPLATYQVLEKRAEIKGTNIKNICFITQQGSVNNKLADKMKNNADIEATVTVTTYPETKQGQIINVNVCFTEAVHAFIMGDKGGQLTQSQKDEYKFLVKSVLGDPQLIMDVDKNFDNFMNEQFKSTSKITTTDIDKEYLTVYVAAATYA